MMWLSIDPATTSGVAVWCDSTLQHTFVVKPRGAKGAWYCGATVCNSRLQAWDAAYRGVEAVVIERGFGGMQTANRAQGMQVGWHQYACAVRGLEYPVEVNVAEWRRVIKEDQQVSWPRDSKRCKQLSQQLAAKLYGVELGEDESDAVLIGRAALRMGVVPK